MIVRIVQHRALDDAALLVILLVFVSAACPMAGAQSPLNYRTMYEKPNVDLAVSNVTITPTLPRTGDLAVFGASIKIIENVDIFFDRFWVDLRCLLDGNLWSEEKVVFSGTLTVDVYSQKPWQATSGAHNVTWEIGPYQEYDDVNGVNNVRQYSFAVGDSKGDFDFSVVASPLLVVTNGKMPGAYQINVDMRGGTEQIDLSIPNIPQGLDYSFSKLSSVSSYSSRLQVQSTSTRRESIT